MTNIYTHKILMARNNTKNKSNEYCGGHYF